MRLSALSSLQALAASEDRLEELYRKAHEPNRPNADGSFDLEPTMSPHLQPDREAYLSVVYQWANRRYFKSKLKNARLQVGRMSSNSPFGLSGEWHSGRRTLTVHPTVFSNDSELRVRETIVHEMCHQAVTDIDGYTMKDNPKEMGRTGHGAAWQRWMKHCGQRVMQRYLSNG